MGLFEFIERNSLFISLMVFIVLTVGGVVEIIPSFYANAQPTTYSKPYTALELGGKLVYHKEGCIDCHSQLIRPFKVETDRYGRFSLSGEYAFDRPFLFGSRRIGPDLFRVGARRSINWLEQHFKDAASTSPGTLMPNYTWFFENNLDVATVYADMLTNKKVFAVPYDQPGYPTLGTKDEMKQQMIEDAKIIAEEMKDKEPLAALENGEIKEIFAILAYLKAKQ